MHKAADALRSIGEVSRLVGVPTHVLRYWETQFPQLAPVKRPDGRRYYRPDDLALAAGLAELLRDEGMTARGAQKLLGADKGAAVRARGRARLPERFRTDARPRAAEAAEAPPAASGEPPSGSASLQAKPAVLPAAPAQAPFEAVSRSAEVAALPAAPEAPLSETEPLPSQPAAQTTLHRPSAPASLPETAPSSPAPAEPVTPPGLHLPRLRAAAAALRGVPPSGRLARQRAALAALLGRA